MFLCALCTRRQSALQGLRPWCNVSAVRRCSGQADVRGAVGHAALRASSGQQTVSERALGRVAGVLRVLLDAGHGGLPGIADVCPAYLPVRR